MRRTLASTAVCVSLLVLSPSGQTPLALRVIDWNVHHDGVGTDGVADLGRIAAWLQSRNPDIVTMNEISAAAATDLENRMEMATGTPWDSAHFGASGGEGEAVLSRYPIVASSRHWMQDGVRKALQVSVDVEGRVLNVIATHLQNGDFPAVRASQIQELLAFAAGYPEPRLIAGDINAAPDYGETQPLFAGYVDAWEDARQRGGASAYADNPASLFTRTQWKRIDYILPSAVSGLQTTACEVPDQRDLGNFAVAVTIGTTDDRGVRPSDHNLLSCVLAMGPSPGSSDSISPQVAFTSPAEGAPLQAVVPFVAGASDNVSIDRVEFRVDGALAAVDRWPPYEYGWRIDTAGSGTHIVDAVAFDAVGNLQSVRRTYTIPDPAGTTTRELVMYAADSLVRVGGWAVVADAEAAGGTRLVNNDAGQPPVSTPMASPAHYFELTFPAEAGRPYHLWLRGRASANSWSNDSVYVQYSDSVTSSGVSTWQIGSTSAQTVELEDFVSAGLSAWGWQDNGFGADVLGPPIYFSTTGIHTVRIQVREDGISLDQVVLSSGTYAGVAPGGTKNDHTLITRSVLQPATMPASPPPPPPPPPPANLPPSVSVTSPVNGAQFVGGSTITLVASATDSDGTVTRVEFYDGRKLVGTDVTAPFSLSWTNAAVGTHSLTARATDDAGATAVSPVVSIQVKKAIKR